MRLTVFVFTNDTTTPFPEINEHYELKRVSRADIPDYATLSRKIREEHPVVFVTTENPHTWAPLYELPYEYRRKWIHFSTIPEINSSTIEHCYLHALKLMPKEKNDPNPLFSVITTTFHSDKKIFRPYESLKAQTYRNWEWILWDDSKPGHEDIWKQIQEFQRDDIRIKCYKDTNHSGYIGHMKWLSASLSKGDWLVEIDHDDIVDPNLFQWCVDAIKQYPDADFLCSSCIELNEGSEGEFAYGDYFGLGYGSYHKQWLRGKWHNVCPIEDITPTTIRHIVGVPNHVRIWRRSFYEQIGRHNRDLPVVDDYELLVRSLLAGKWVRIQAPAYFQYRNTGGNNFTFLRNKLIQYLSRKTYELYFPEITQRWKELGDDPGRITSGKAWELTEGYSHTRHIRTFVPNVDITKTVSVCIPVEDDVTFDDLYHTVMSIHKQTYGQLLIYIVGNKSNTLNHLMDRLRASCNDSVIDRIQWWNMGEKKDLQIVLNYFHRMLAVTEWIAYAVPGQIWTPDYLETAFAELTQKFGKERIWFSPEIAKDAVAIQNVVHHYDLIKDYTSFGNEAIKDLCPS